MDAPARTFDESPPIAYIRRERFVPRWWRWRNYLKAVAAVLVLLVFSSGGYAFLRRNVATKVTLTDAVGQFRSATQAATPVTITRTTAVDGPSGQRVAGGRAPAQAASPAARQPARVAAVAPTAYILPPVGVYTYRTTGGEQISLGGAHHDYPSETTATVTHLGGCRWQMRNDVIKEHEDLRTFCGEPKDLSQLSQGRWVTFYGKRDGEEFTFAPPMLVSAVGEGVGSKSVADGKDPSGDGAHVNRTYLGRVPITIGTRTIQAVRLHLAGTSSGKSQGTFVDDLWLDPLTGLTLRWDRSVDEIANASFGAHVHYTEKANFVLESVTPQT